MGRTNTYENGAWKAICDVCGREYKSYQLTMRWDGLMVCQGDWEPRHPQDFVRGVADKIAPPWTRPEPEDYFIFFCTPTTSQGLADIGVADCAKSDIDSSLPSSGLPPPSPPPTLPPSTGGGCTAEGISAIPHFAIPGCSIPGKVFTP